MLDSTPRQDHIVDFWSLGSPGCFAGSAPTGQVQKGFRSIRRISSFAPSRSRHLRASDAAGRFDPHIIDEQSYGLGASILDGAGIILASIASGVGYQFWSPGSPVDPSVFAGAGFLVSLLFCGIVRSRTLQTPFGTSQPGRRARDGLSSWIIAFGLFLLVLVTMKVSAGLPRGGIVAFFLAGAVSVTVSRVKAPLWLAPAICKSALDGQDAIVIGPRNCRELSRLTDALRETTHHEPLPVVFDATCSDEAWPREVRQTLKHARRLAHNAGPGKILVLGQGLSQDRLESLVAELVLLPRAICIVPDETVSGFLSRKRTLIGGHIAVEVQPAPLNATQRALKRALDIALASLLLITLSPFLGLIAALIKCDSPGPVFFRQFRTGYRGQLFRILKFRTMTVLEDGPIVVQACKKDSRVTRIGGILRRTSLDELPQLLNVLAGDMSLVGPRPHAVAHDKSYVLQIPDYVLRQHVLPGITGWAQVNGLRGETSTIDAMHRRVEHDIWYARNCSLFLDVQIMVRTFFEVMRARNAY
jgi:putative colanic acid biosynthesis UDP-glucose lipid carrier transferase